MIIPRELKKSAISARVPEKVYNEFCEECIKNKLSQGNMIIKMLDVYKKNYKEES